MTSPSANKRRSAQSILFVAAAFLSFLLLSLPVMILILRAALSAAWAGLPGTMLIADAALLSFLTTATAVLLILLLGTPLAYVLARWRFPGRRIVTVMVELPVVMPPAVAGLALLLTFGRSGFFGPALNALNIQVAFSTTAVILAQVFVAAPFFIRAAQTGFSGVPREIEDAAKVDGANGLDLFRFVTLPLSFNALAAGLTLSWARAMGEFGATILFAGSLQGKTQTLPLLVYAIFERDLDAAIFTGLILIGLALGALLFSQWLLRRSLLEEN